MYNGIIICVKHLHNIIYNSYTLTVYMTSYPGLLLAGNYFITLPNVITEPLVLTDWPWFCSERESSGPFAISYEMLSLIE